LREGGLPRLVERTAIKDGVDEDNMMTMMILRRWRLEKERQRRQL
jgi:hypothetical protein